VQTRFIARSCLFSALLSLAGYQVDQANHALVAICAVVPMKTAKSRSRLLLCVSLGFGLMILLAWVDEFLGLSVLVFGGGTHIPDWRDATMASVLILIVWAAVFIIMRRLLAHLVYLEGFLRVCAWCRKVGFKDKWLPLEDYFDQGFHIGTTHGMCPECFQKFKKDTAQYARQDFKKRDLSPQEPNTQNKEKGNGEQRTVDDGR